MFFSLSFTEKKKETPGSILQNKNAYWKVEQRKKTWDYKLERKHEWEKQRKKIMGNEFQILPNIC